MGNKPKTKPAGGFANMTPEQRSAVSRLGGKARHEAGVGHEWDSAAARRAGKLSGRIRRRNKQRKQGAHGF